MPDKSGIPTYQWSLTSPAISDIVKLVAGPFNMLPVVFIPGIMGSNLRSKTTGAPVWRLDTSLGQPLGLARKMVFKDAGDRQTILHPAKCEVDPTGHVPDQSAGSVYGGAVTARETYAERGWGSVAESSYHNFLLWLEEHLNPGVRNPALWGDYYQDETTIGPVPSPNSEPKLHPGIRMGMVGQSVLKDGRSHNFVVNSDDLIKHSKFLMPVYAVGYNWLESNSVASAKLRSRIVDIIRANSGGSYVCKQVILVTHSMGGLVARACAELPGMTDAIAGIVHGAMPSIGAAVAYRRCKLGMSEEGLITGLILGSTGKEVTSVFSQAPGALQLLPAQAYSNNWLKVKDSTGKVLASWPVNGDPFTDIYKVSDRWWGLVDERWLAPQGGIAISWDAFMANIDLAQKFHAKIENSYHPVSYVSYGADDKKKSSFESITWRIQEGLAPDSKPRPTAATILGMSSEQTRMLGTNPGYVGGQADIVTSYSDFGSGSTIYQTSYWELHCDLQDGTGDGTVPKSSGAAPLAKGGTNVNEQFEITGIKHEPAYQNHAAQITTLYSITKILSKARIAT